jgi:hypothetical protein
MAGLPKEGASRDMVIFRTKETTMRKSMLTVRKKQWSWLIAGACLLSATPLVWAGNVSPTIQDTGASVGIGTDTPNASYKLDIFNGQILNSRTDGIAGGLGALQRSNYTGSRVIFNFFADGLDNTGVLRNLGQLYFTQDGPSSARISFGTNAGGGMTDKLTIMGNGSIGIGTANPTAMLHVTGDARFDGNIAAKYQDVAEWVRTPRPLTPGTVVVIDATGPNQVVEGSKPFDPLVAGVVSARPGVLLGEKSDDKVAVAHSGRVKVKVDARYGPVAVGDLLVTSSTTGHAMRATDSGGTTVKPGTLLGKALEPLASGQGEILVLLTLQ